MNLSKSLLIGAVALLTPFVGHAASITSTAALSSNPTLSANGLTFSNFACSISNSGVLVTPTDCSSINVGLNAAGNGINFTSGFMAAGMAFNDVSITYHVDSTSSLDLVGLSFNGFFFGQAITSVTETVDNSGNQVGNTLVACGAPVFGSGCNQTSTIGLNGNYTSLDIVKDINLTSFSGSANASIVGQTFAEAPEPSSIALMGGGLLAAAMMLRRKLNLGAKPVAA